MSPGAAELFRPTDTFNAEVTSADVVADPQPGPDASSSGPDASSSGVGRTGANGKPTHTGRVRHDEKITVYVSREELLALEQARIELRGDHNLAADRGRIVRAAIALALEDFAASGVDSDLARRLAT